MSNYSNLRTLYGHEASVNKNDVTGTVYTPKWLAQQMIFQLIDSHVSPSISLFDLFINGYLQNIINASFEKQAKEILNEIASLKIMDLSCGSGVLLLTYLEFVEYLAKCSNQDIGLIMTQIIEDNLFGIDIDRDAIAVFNETLNAYYDKLCITPSKTNIYCGNSLIEDFVNETKFDFIIGNPPYIGEKNNLEWFQPIKKTDFGKKYYEGKMDYFYFFIYRAWELLKDEGTICYLSSNYFLSADGARHLRTFLKTNLFFDRYIDYGASRVFPERKLHACIYALKKQNVEFVTMYDENYQIKKRIPFAAIYQDDNIIKFISSDVVQTRINQIKAQKIGLLGDLYQVHQGIVSGSDAAFVYNESDLSLLPVEALKYAVPFYKNSDVKHYYANTQTKLRLLYLNHSAIDENVITWMQQYKQKLSVRREVVKGIREWYTLTWPRDASIFEKEKIVVPQRAKTNRFAYVEGSFYASADVYYIQQKENSPYHLKILCLLLNSSAYFEWLKHMGKRKGQLLELYATPLKAIPIIKLSKVDLTELENIASHIFSSHPDIAHHEMKKIDDTEFKRLTNRVDEIIANNR